MDDQNDVANTLKLGLYLNKQPTDFSDFLGQQFVRKIVRILTDGNVSTEKIATTVYKLLECLEEQSEVLTEYDRIKHTERDSE